MLIKFLIVVLTDQRVKGFIKFLNVVLIITESGIN